jgi:DNA primase
LGTAFTQGQVRQLLRYTDSKQVILNFDADKAGIKATQRALTEIEPLIYSGQVQARVLNLPDGKDADEFLSMPDGISQYNKALSNAPLWIDWRLIKIAEEKDLADTSEFQEASQEMIRLLANIEHPSLRSQCIGTATTILAGEDRIHRQKLQENFFYQVKKLTRLKWGYDAENLGELSDVIENSPLEQVPVATASMQLVQAEEHLMRLYLHHPAFRRQIENQLAEQELMFSISHNRWLWQQIIEIPKEIKQNLAHNQLLGRILDILTNYPEKMHILGTLLYLNEKTEIDIQRVPLQIKAAIATMQYVNHKRHYEYCRSKYETMDPSHPDYHYYMQEFCRLKQELIETNKKRNFSNIEVTKHDI